jgi:hypothetical protein
MLDAQLLSDWQCEDGASRQIDLLLKDWGAGSQQKRLEAQVSASASRSRIRPSKGFGPKPGRKPVHLWGDIHKDRHNFSHWVERRSENPVHVQFNSKEWKSHAARRLMTTVGAPSCVLLPGEIEKENTLLAEHFTAEIAKEESYDGHKGVAWEEIVGRDNDWWDCFVGNNVAASMLGCSLNGEVSKPSQPVRKKFSMPGR